MSPNTGKSYGACLEIEIETEIGGGPLSPLPTNLFRLCTQKSNAISPLLSPSGAAPKA